MPAANLDTTNLLLGIMAAVSVLEAAVLIALVIMAYRAYRDTIHVIHRLESDQIRPLVTRVNDLLTKADSVVGEVQTVTSTVTRRTEHAAEVMARPVTRAVGLARGVLVALETLFNHRQEREAWPRAAGSAGRAEERSEYYGG